MLHARMHAELPCRRWYFGLTIYSYRTTHIGIIYCTIVLLIPGIEFFGVQSWLSIMLGKDANDLVAEKELQDEGKRKFIIERARVIAAEHDLILCDWDTVPTRQDVEIEPHLRQVLSKVMHERLGGEGEDSIKNLGILVGWEHQKIGLCVGYSLCGIDHPYKTRNNGEFPENHAVHYSHAVRKSVGKLSSGVKLVEVGVYLCGYIFVYISISLSTTLRIYLYIYRYMW